MGKKRKQFKIYSFDRFDIKDREITVSDLEEKTITISESFLTYALEKYKGKTLEDNQQITEIVKLMLPHDEEKAKREWFEGISFNGNKYYGWFATTNGMKKEKCGICETIFIREDFKSFAEEIEALISLGKFREIEDNGTELCINKDILSRISLVTSESEIAGNMPNFIVLPQPKYKITKEYKTVQKYNNQGLDTKGNSVDIVDYNLVDYNFNDQIDVDDGGGIASPGVFEQIKANLQIKYPVEFAIIRAYGLGIKGMITRFDIIRYLNENYKNDTDYCKKVNGRFYLLDCWKEWQPITNKTILLNESMVKLAKHFKNIDEYKTLLDKVDEKYKDLLNKLYVTKINKKDDDIKEYRRTNYQLMNALAITPKKYFDLANEDMRVYKKILNSYVKDEDGNWKIDIDTIRLFFKSVVSSEDEEEIIDKLNSVVSKSHELLNISENFIKLKYVKNNLAKLIEKRCRELACGKITVKAKYQYIAVCPISYMNYAMSGDQGDNGLNENEFYSGDCQDGDIRTISRNPLCAYSEVHNIKFIRNELLDGYLSPCRELIYFNQKSDILALMSSADTDGDACTVIDNEIIKNAVVTPKDKKYFINTSDGKVVPMKYTKENRFYATFRAAGNLIGSIALKSASINSQAQHIPDYFDTKSRCFLNKRDIDINDKEEKKKLIEEKLETGEWIKGYYADEELKEYIVNRFYDYEKEIYIVLYNAMIAIDAPKTLYFPSKADMKVLDDKYYKKAWFLQYKENKNEVDVTDYRYDRGLLDVFSKVVETRLLKEINTVITKFDNKVEIIQKKLINGDYNISQYNECFSAINEMYIDYSKERTIADREYYKKQKDESDNRDLLIDNLSWSQSDDEMYFDAIAKYKKEKYKKFKDIDSRFIKIADDITKKYDIATVANALANLDKCTEDFIINLFYPVFEFLNSKLQSTRYLYKRSEEENHGDVFYMHEAFKKLPVNFFSNISIVQNLHLEEKKRLKAIPVKKDLRAKILDEGIIDLIKSEISINQYIKFDIQVYDEDRVILARDGNPLLEVFKDKGSIQVNQYNLLNCKGIKVEMLGKVNEKSISFTITEIYHDDIGATLRYALT